MPGLKAYVICGVFTACSGTVYAMDCMLGWDECCLFSRAFIFCFFVFCLLMPEAQVTIWR